VQELDGLLTTRVGTLVCADLDDAVVFLGSLYHSAAFGDARRGRFLDVHVLARLTGPNRCQGMSVVRQRDADAVDVLVVKYAAEVRFGFRIAAGNHFGPVSEKRLVAVAERGDSHAGRSLMVIDVVSALITDAEDGRANFIIRADGPASLILRPSFVGKHGRHR
jgi:hypothetical protein